jgi:hypothetical protein
LTFRFCDTRTTTLVQTARCCKLLPQFNNFFPFSNIIKIQQKFDSLNQNHLKTKVQCKLQHSCYYGATNNCSLVSSNKSIPFRRNEMYVSQQQNSVISFPKCGTANETVKQVQMHFRCRLFVHAFSFARV